MRRHLSLAVAALIAPAAFFGQMMKSKDDDQKMAIECRNNFDTSLEFLMWTADVDGSNLATYERTVNRTATNKVINLDGKWEPGCRVMGGYHFGFFDQWDALGTWTYYHGKSGSESRTVNGTTELLSQNWNDILGPVATFAKGHWSLNMNLADLELARSYVITPRLTMRPHAGVRGGWIDLNYMAQYTGRWTSSVISTAAETNFTQNTNFKGESDFGGGGLVAGSGLRWAFNENWAFWGNLTASLLYGTFHVKEHFNGADLIAIEESVDPPADTVALVSERENYRDRFNRIRGTLDLMFGVEARTQFNKDRSRMTLFLGYELLKLFRFNELFTVNREFDNRFLTPLTESTASYAGNEHAQLQSLSNDIGFQGITAKVEFEF